MGRATNPDFIQRQAVRADANRAAHESMKSIDPHGLMRGSPLHDLLIGAMRYSYMRGAGYNSDEVFVYPWQIKPEKRPSSSE